MAKKEFDLANALFAVEVPQVASAVRDRAVEQTARGLMTDVHFRESSLESLRLDLVQVIVIEVTNGERISNAWNIDGKVKCVGLSGGDGAAGA